MWQPEGCHNPLCIILEERREMNKKILGAAATLTFFLYLTVTSNIQESGSTKHATVQETHATVQNVTEENDEVSARVGLVLSVYSFTTESDEAAEVEKRDTAIVATPEEMAEAETEEEGEQKEEEQKEEEHKDENTVTNRWGISLTDEEIDLLARIVWLEAGGEPELGQQAVVEVILNRMASDIYPDTLYDVLSQKHPVQFCSWKNRDIAKPTEKEYQSIEQVLSGNTNILRNDTLYFSTMALTPNVDMRIGGHSFCY